MMSMSKMQGMLVVAYETDRTRLGRQGGTYSDVGSAGVLCVVVVVARSISVLVGRVAYVL